MPIKLTENFRAVFYAPFYATQALGFYAREGVDVELMNSTAPAAAESDLLGGVIDLSWGGPIRVMKARDKDSSSRLVCFCEVALEHRPGSTSSFAICAHRSALRGYNEVSAISEQ
jgi:NitT/TauT family transport system substrate-binding protein